MVSISENISLKSYNTFGIDVYAKNFCVVNNKAELIELIQHQLSDFSKYLILGGGSNILFTQNFDGLVIKNEIKGINIIEETDDDIYLEVKSGTVWHDLVMYCVEHNYQGVENLALIPGTVGAAPVQNIGAYGVEIKSVLEQVHLVDLNDASELILDNKSCRFGYRDSVFKNELKGKYFIDAVVLKLKKQHFDFKTSYGSIIDEIGTKPINIQTIADAVIAIRSSKLPNPNVLGNAGSFFKNPEISKTDFYNIQQEYPNVPHYIISDELIKIPAAWLIEQCGFKGKVFGNTGSHAQQCLVIVNYGNAKGNEILEHAHRVIQAVDAKFGIKLTPEVNII